MLPAKNHENSLRSIKRLMMELEELNTNPPPLCSAVLREDNLFLWEGTIRGPPDSPYEGGEFKVHIDFPKNYPFRPPKVVFKTKIYHCNINERGNISLDILRSRWSPSLKASSILLSLCSLLTDCNPKKPLDATIAKYFRTDQARHDGNARKWTQKYAMP